MTALADVIDAYERGEQMAMAYLVKADFMSGPACIWTGVKDLEHAGETWRGIGEIMQISPVRRGDNGQADPFDVTVFASDALYQSALIEFNAEARDREISVYIQFFGGRNEFPLGPPWQIRRGIMRGSAMAADLGVTSLTITADTLSSLRGRPAYAMLTDRDLRARFPDDPGLEFVAGLDGSEVEWPVFD